MSHIQISKSSLCRNFRPNSLIRLPVHQIPTICALMILLVRPPMKLFPMLLPVNVRLFLNYLGINFWSQIIASAGPGVCKVTTLRQAPSPLWAPPPPTGQTYRVRRKRSAGTTENDKDDEEKEVRTPTEGQCLLVVVCNGFYSLPRFFTQSNRTVICPKNVKKSNKHVQWSV